ncbi:hypothetical protein AB7714_27880 [Tardiphaga sp. 1201_B9_N1_1]|nr:hypothetical protein [Tardiphaga sp. 37S4]
MAEQIGPSGWLTMPEMPTVNRPNVTANAKPPAIVICLAAA